MNVPGLRSEFSTLMFLVGLHSEGRFFSLEIPEPSGPRHCGQFPADVFAAETDETGECYRDSDNKS